MLSWLFSSPSNPSPPTPAPPGTRVVPCSILDLNVAQEWVYTVGLVVPAQLDPQKLKESLLMLIERKFPRAGARLAFRNGAYEFQIPDKFDAETPAASFTVERHTDPCPHRDTVLPSSTPSSTSKPSLVITPPPSLATLLRSPTCPQTLSAFLHPHVPLLHIHLSLYPADDNLTLIGVTMPHIAFDGVGIGVLLRAWTHVLNHSDGGDWARGVGSVEGMPWDLVPFGEGDAARQHRDAVDEGEGEELRLARGWFPTTLRGTFTFLARMVYSQLCDPRDVMLYVRVPKAWLRGVKAGVMDDLSGQTSGGGGSEQREKERDWVGSSDVLVAWWVKLLHAHRAPTDTTPLHVHMAKDLRPLRIFSPSCSSPSDPAASSSPDPLPLPNTYINNAWCNFPALTAPVSALQRMSVGEVAVRVRRAILGYTGAGGYSHSDVEGDNRHDVDAGRRNWAANILHDVAWLSTKANAQKIKTAQILPCPPDGECLNLSNWRAAGFGGLDFGGGVVDGVDADVGETALSSRTDSKKKVKVAFVHWYASSNTSTPVPRRQVGTVLMEDEEVVWVGKMCGAGEAERVRRIWGDFVGV
ncbi:hypothetical protein R3P38DRAFT_3345995 [Favolaschia claudopus]|uniref:Uncharacterized protein n=1 Tax=Favolaschia claudopus TaxID=2862362 RepID=A0AAW0DDM2_9AGAR